MSELYARLSIGINEICQLIHSRRVVSLQHTAGAHSIQDIHLNLDEVRAFLTQALPKGYDKKELAVILRLNSIGLKFIADQQLIRSEVYRSPFSNQPMAYFFDDAIDEFFASYVPLSFLARHRGVQARVAHVELNGLGIHPLETPRKSGLLYRREDLPADWQVSKAIWRSPENLSRLSRFRKREISAPYEISEVGNEAQMQG